MRQNVAGSEACLVKWKLCDEESQTCPGPWDDPYGCCIGNALAGIAPLQAQTPSAAVTKIQTYYQQLMPTIQQAARLSVRDATNAFRLSLPRSSTSPTMTRLAVGPAWKSFSAEQQAAARDAFAGFIVAEYASQIKDYSGESFVVDPQTRPNRVAAARSSKRSCCSPAVGSST